MTPQVQAVPELPVVGYHGVDHDGFEMLALKENQVLRMFNAGEVIAQPVCLVSDALTYVESLKAELEAARAALLEAEIGLANLGSYQSAPTTPNIHEFGRASRALALVRAALSNHTPTKEQSK